MRETRVLHILGALQASGMERMLASAARDFAALGIRGFVMGQGVAHSYVQPLEEAGYTVFLVNPSLRFRYARSELRDFIRHHRIDVVHIHTEGNYLMTVIACKMVRGRRIRVIRTIHNVFGAVGIWRVKRTVQALVADRFVDELIAPSEDVARNEMRFLRSPDVILNWVDASFYDVRVQRGRSKPVTEPPVGLIVGNCSKIKNHGFALEVANLLGHNIAHIGAEAGASELEVGALNAMEAAGRLVCRGSQDPIRPMLDADYFLMPSLNEGMPVSLAEALAAGVPIFAADSPGMQWLAGVDGTRLLPLQTSAWTAAISEQLGKSHREETSQRDATPPDLSSARGALAYSKLYQK